MEKTPKDVAFEEMRETLKQIANMLDNVGYECCAREYTLNEDEMATIFYCRDVAQKVLRSISGIE